MTADCPRCAALTRGRAFVAQVRENGGNGWEPTAELVEALCGDLAQARQALRRLVDSIPRFEEDAEDEGLAEWGDATEEMAAALVVAREALVERGTEQTDTGGGSRRRVEEGRDV